MNIKRVVPLGILFPGVLMLGSNAALFGFEWLTWMSALLACSVSTALLWYLRYGVPSVGSIFIVAISLYLTARPLVALWSSIENPTSDDAKAMTGLVVLFMIIPIMVGIAAAFVAEHIRLNELERLSDS